MFQIGITNVPDKRLAKHKKSGWTVVDVRGPMDGLLTMNLETSLLRMLKGIGADVGTEKVAGKFDGYSEAWTQVSFKAENIVDLLHLLSSFEDRKGKRGSK